jgi:uncharacterized protein involved in exopolysaccharide biosynthesis
MNSAQKRVEAAQKSIEKFKLKHSLYSLSDQRSQLLNKRNDAERRAQSIKSDTLQKEIAGYNEGLNALDKQESMFTSLQKEMELASEAYSLSAHRFEEAKAYEQLQHDRASSVRVIQPPSVPVEPKKLMTIIILAGTVLSILSALFTAGISEFFRRGLMTPEEAERQLNLPVLAVLPFMSGRR